MAKVHPTAIVEDGAVLADGVEVGPFCVVGAKVRLDKGVRLVSHNSVTGNTVIGENTLVHPFAALGQPPQSLAYKGEDTRLVVGKNNIIREHVTMHPGLVSGRGETTIGDNCMFMAGSHIAHDCKLGNHIVIANNTMLGGHVDVADYVWFGGGSAVHQYSRIGRHAFVGGMAGLEGDLIPFGSVIGNRAHLAGLNLVGLKRRGFSREVIHDVRAAYRLLFAEEGTLQERIDDVAETFANNAEVMEIITFMRQGKNRSLCLPRRDEHVEA